MQKEPCLERQTDLYMQAIVLSITVLRHDTLLSFSLSDGSIEFRFRDSLELASADGNNEEVHSLPQSGFAFPAQDPGKAFFTFDVSTLTYKSPPHYSITKYMLCCPYASRWRIKVKEDGICC
jgi:Mediator complex subunit 16